MSESENVHYVDYTQNEFSLMIKGLLLTANYLVKDKPADEFNEALLNPLDFILQNIIELIASLRALQERQAERAQDV